MGRTIMWGLTAHSARGRNVRPMVHEEGSCETEDLAPKSAAHSNGEDVKAAMGSGRNLTRM